MVEMVSVLFLNSLLKKKELLGDTIQLCNLKSWCFSFSFSMKFHGIMDYLVIGFFIFYTVLGLNC